MVNQILPRVESVVASALAVQSAEPVMSPAARHLDRGRELCAAGRINAAIAAFRAGLDAAGLEPIDSSHEMIAELHAELGDAYLRICRAHDGLPFLLQAF